MPTRALLPFEGLRDDVQKLYRLLGSEDDIGVVVIGAAFLDAVLGTLLGKFFVEGNTSRNLLEKGVLGDFVVRAKLAYVLGLISKDALKDIVSIAEIRNSFAHHHLALSFDAPEISEKCKGLRYGIDVIKVLDIPEDLILAKSRFTVSVVTISQRLLVDCIQTERERRQKLELSS